ncbi:MAG: oxidoreductase [Actinomycetota bacterium]|nr:oxidoreductase [Actinomycetota bacterium]
MGPRRTVAESMEPRWTAAEIPDQSGRGALVTGANSGLGLATARALSDAGARVLLASRDKRRGERARALILGGDVRVVELDLADLGSVRACASSLHDELEQLDLLILNAGVMAPPRRLTRDGFESQIGTNHLGHFALTGLLLNLLLAAPAARVVTVSSGAHRIGKIDFDDLHGERSYGAWRAYGQSKLANLMFCFELQRRAVAAGAELKSVAAHPGYAATNLQFAGPSRFHERAVMALTNKLIAQSAEMGALPTLFAATVCELPGGTFIGPDGFMEERGYPHVVTAASKAYDEGAWRRLWEVSSELTGVRYDFGVTAAPAG